jgi:hypothetical protein
LPSRQPYGKSSTQRMQLKASTGRSAKQPKHGAAFQPMMPQQSGSTWRSATSGKQADASENGLSHMQACVTGNSMPHAISSLSYTQNGSTDDPSKLHGLSLIHRISDTPRICGSWRSSTRNSWKPRGTGHVKRHSSCSGRAINAVATGYAA